MTLARASIKTWNTRITAVSSALFFLGYSIKIFSKQLSRVINTRENCNCWIFRCSAQNTRLVRVTEFVGCVLALPLFSIFYICLFSWVLNSGSFTLSDLYRDFKHYCSLMFQPLITIQHSSRPEAYFGNINLRGVLYRSNQIKSIEVFLLST